MSATSSLTAPWPVTLPMRLEAHYGDRVALCPVGRPPNLDALLRTTAARRPDAEAVVDGGRRLSFAELDRAASALAAAFQARGVGPGERVALLLNNRLEFVLSIFAALRLGAVVVMLNPRQQMPEIEFNLTDSGARLLVFEADLADRVPPAAAVPALTHRVAVDSAIAGTVAGAEPFEALAEGAGEAAAEVAEEAPAFIIYTSGTTGKPKGAVMTHLSVVTSVLHYEACWGLTQDDRAMMAVPGSHVTGLIAILLTMVRAGGATILLRNFKARDFLELAGAERMTYTLLVPAMYNLCLLQTDLGAFDLSNWRIGGYGGSPMPLATFDAVARSLPNLDLRSAYGATETSSPVTLTPPGDGAAHADCVGLPLPGADIRIMDDDGRELPDGETGEIWIGGGMVGTGYWGNPEANATGFTAGYWHSGDIGRRTEDGFIQVLDRKKDMINRAGYKVYSAEVENVLALHPGIGEAAVIPEPDPVLGEKVHAVVLVTDSGLTVEAVRAYCAERLSNYKVPDLVTFTDQPLPRNANGKILKRALKKD
jgi:acyl-CoA synthetase (AMP-forming)/AMP-acid ligase II